MFSQAQMMLTPAMLSHLLPRIMMTRMQFCCQIVQTSSYAAQVSLFQTTSTVSPFADYGPKFLKRNQAQNYMVTNTAPPRTPLDFHLYWQKGPKDKLNAISID